jgi:hypothetical protein
MLYYRLGSSPRSFSVRHSSSHPFWLAQRLFRKLALALGLALIFSAVVVAHPGKQFPPNSSPSLRRLRDSDTRQGPFTVANQRYTVLFQYKVLSEDLPSTAASAKSMSTLSRLEILNARDAVIYHQDFPSTVTQGRLQEHLTASASLLSGNGGVALVLRFLDRPDHPEGAGAFAKESWQLFTTVDGQLRPLGPMLPLGHGGDITVGGVVTAVMMKGGIAVMPMASSAEVLALRIWTGNFYVLVPVRFDWAHGQWGEGQQCYRTANGTLTESGCIMPVQAGPQPRSPDADLPYVQLFVGPDGNTEGSASIMITPSKQLEFLETFAIVQWHTEGLQGQRVACTFDDVWLRIRIDGHEGWVHGQDAFDALGLPQTSPAP